MIKTSLAYAKTHLFALVDQAEHHNKRFLILRRGKPAAAIVPVSAAAAGRKRPTPMTKEDAERSVLAFIDEFSSPERETSAVEDLLQGRT